MANEIIAAVRRPRVFRIFRKVDMVTPNTFHTRQAVGRFKTMEIYGKLFDIDGGTPIVTMVVNAIRPEAPATDPVAAADKVALTKDVVNSVAGTIREKYGPGETDATLPDDIEFVITMAGVAAQADYDAWIILHD